MAKLTAKKDYRKDGTTNIKAYSISLQKTECEKNGFDCSSNIDIEYSKNKIILKKRGV